MRLLNIHILSTIVLTVITSLAFPASAHAIFGGQDAGENEFPSQVSLEENGAHICGASLLSSTQILTAAHCVQNVPKGNLSVRTGSIHRDRAKMTAAVKGVRIHPSYRKLTSNHDLAILTLSKPVSGTPAELAQDKSVYRPGKMGTMVGWGQVNVNGPLQTRLRKVTLPIISNERCAEIFGETSKTVEKTTDSMVCISPADKTQRKSGGSGDSGGPLFINGKLAGVFSLSQERSLAGYPSTFARTLPEMEWIEQTLEK